MILDDIVEKEKNKYKEKKIMIELPGYKEMALNSKNKNHGFKEDF